MKSLFSAAAVVVSPIVLAIALLYGCNKPNPVTPKPPNHQLVSYIVGTKQGGVKYGYVTIDGSSMTFGAISSIYEIVSHDTNAIATNMVIINVVPIY